jgi:hypothetical protein
VIKRPRRRRLRVAGPALGDHEKSSPKGQRQGGAAARARLVYGC